MQKCLLRGSQLILFLPTFALHKALLRWAETRLLAPHRSSIDCYIFIIHLNKNNVMSKTAQTLIDKAASLAEGMKRNMDKAQQLGIDNKQ